MEEATAARKAAIRAMAKEQERSNSQRDREHAERFCERLQSLAESGRQDVWLGVNVLYVD